MDKYIEIRKLWDEIFKSSFGKTTIQCIGVISVILSTYALCKITPFQVLIPGQIIMVLPVIMGALFLVSSATVTALFALIIIVSLSNTIPILAVITGVILLFAASAPKILQIVFILTPLCLMNFHYIESALLSVNLPFMIIILGVYFCSKLGEHGYLVGYAFYYTLLAFCFNVYTNVANAFRIFTKKELTVPADAEDMTISDKYFDLIDVTGSIDLVGDLFASIIIVLFINLFFSYAIWGLSGIKHIKVIKYPIDMREAVLFLIAASLLLLSLLGISFIDDMEPYDKFPVLEVLIQCLLAYILTRPFASNDAVRILSRKLSGQQEDRIKSALGKAEYAKTAEEEFQSILKTYLDEKLYNDTLDGDKYPVNSILLFGDKELDKRLVVQNFLKGYGFDVSIHDGGSLMDEFEASGKIACLERTDTFRKQTVFIIDRIEGFVSAKLAGNIQEECIEYIADKIREHRQNRKVFFVLTASNTNSWHDAFLENSMVEKSICVSRRESVTLGKTYQLLSPIGRGGSGLIYKAYHIRLKNFIVVKKIIANFKDKSLYRAEAEALKKIKHSYLPRVYDIFEESGEHYTVMDFIPGTTLQQKAHAAGQIDERDVIKWAEQLGDVVGYLHSQQPPIIHSDIKPDNVMLTPSGDICLIDFNVSLALDKSCSSAIGYTPCYSPIEQYGNYRNYENILLKYGEEPKDPNVIKEYIAKGFDIKSDIYALGASLYFLLAGEPPHINAEKIRSIRYYRNDISNELVYLVDKALQADPDARFANMAEFKKATAEAVAVLDRT